MKAIELAELINGPEIDDCKIHLASWNKKKQPLDVFVSDKIEWQSWNEYRGARNDFNKKYIFTLIDFYPERHVWLFGGLYKVIERDKKGYKVELQSKFENLIGRLKVHYKRAGRTKSVLPDNQFEKMTIAELLKQPYSGEIFPGFEDISHSFGSLEPIFKQEKRDWKSALSSVKGVYLILDKSNGKKYVGAAYGVTGIWSRWASYIGTGHGSNGEFSKLIKQHTIAYARANFIFTLLEYRPMKADDQAIIDREAFWKKALQTQGEFGYNRN